jgi:hypothetical protein
MPRHPTRTRVSGNQNPKHTSTSFVERQNLSLRMSVRPLTRLTNAFSKKLENHAAAIALNYFAYNFIRIHATLRTSPAMAAGVTNKLCQTQTCKVSRTLQSSAATQRVGGRHRQRLPHYTVPGGFSTLMGRALQSLLIESLECAQTPSNQAQKTSTARNL